jgi:hypothetical protein
MAAVAHPFRVVDFRKRSGLASLALDASFNVKDVLFQQSGALIVLG